MVDSGGPIDNEGGVVAVTAVIVSAVVITVLAVLIVSPTADSSATGKDGSKFVAAHRALCRAARRAPADVVRAREIFYDEAHEPLHDLARRVATKRRDLAARVLEAKERVESLLDEPTTELAGDLRQLARQTARSAAAVGESLPASCNREG